MKPEGTKIINISLFLRLIGFFKVIAIVARHISYRSAVKGR
jgi:thermostable 8-oxoguanine DNA glycosylase